MIEKMIALTQKGYPSANVWETSMQYALGSPVKVNKDTTATEVDTGSSVSLTAGTVVTIVDIGGGPSGVDHVAMLEDGRRVVIPYADLGECVQSEKLKEQEFEDIASKYGGWFVDYNKIKGTAKYSFNTAMDAEDFAREVEERGASTGIVRSTVYVQESVDEDITGSVIKVVLNKPLPQSVVDWVERGYVDYGVELPSVPQADDAKSVTFLMKSEDADMLNSAVESLKKIAGASFKSSADATMIDWNKAIGVS